MAEWTKVGIDAGTGAAAGVVDQLIQNRDEKAGIAAAASGVAGAVDANGKLPMLKQWGTYLNYGVPLLAVVGVATGFVKGDWATRAVTAGFQLAGRKATHQFTTGAKSPTPSAGREAAYSQWMAERAAERSYDPTFKTAAVYRMGQL